MAVDRIQRRSVAGFRLPGPHNRFPGAGRRASFTLLELVAVLAIVGVLGALVLGAAEGARQRARRSRARAELALLAQALEAYRLQYGDYPQTGGFASKGAGVDAHDPVSADCAEAKLFNALLGRLGPRCTALTDRHGGPALGRAFHDAANGPALENRDAFPTADADAANAFLDPWGRRYRYFYRSWETPAVWRAPAHVLFSVGPDGASKAGDPAPDGSVDFNDPLNADNLHAGRD